MEVRQATIADVPQIHRLVNSYAQAGLMLRRSLMMLYEHVREFCVVSEDERILGCGGLTILWHDLAEIRCLAVVPEAKGRGLGKAVVQKLEADAHALGLRRVFALTYQVDFFKSCGYTVIKKETLPQKVWKECIHCEKFNACDEIAVIKYLLPATAAAPAAPVADDDSVPMPTWVRP